MPPHSTHSGFLSKGVDVALPPVDPSEVMVRITPLGLRGVLQLPDDPCGIVVLPLHTRCMPGAEVREHVLAALHAAGLGTLAVDVLLPVEAACRFRAVDRGLIARRIGLVVDWLSNRPCSRALPVSLFAMGSGAADALIAAAEEPRIAALVLADGRLDLAGSAPARVVAPTLLVAGDADPVIAAINRRVHASMRCERTMVLLDGQSRAFGGPAAIEVTTALCCDWLRTHLPTRTAEPARATAEADARQRCGRVAESVR
jgi:putative phosphoribosyl transferase